MSKHERQDDKNKYEGNGYDPNRPVPQKIPAANTGSRIWTIKIKTRTRRSDHHGAVVMG
jgi:hypothetical protein